MTILPGYNLIEVIYQDSRTVVYRGERESDKLPVIIKLLNAEYPTLRELVRFRNQYAITQGLNLPGVVKVYNLEDYRHGFALVMEDFKGITLYELMGNNSKEKGKEENLQVEELEKLKDEKINKILYKNFLPITDFLNIAIQIVSTLDKLHNLRVIHKDIKPDHILINPDFKVKLIGFGIASLLPSEQQEIETPQILEGTLFYMSPEQTGRMNRTLDWRTDFYSLGVTFYELLTGQLPFDSTDPIELVHCHIARKPTPPIELNTSLPQVLNNIIIKLLEKIPENRYQTASGLKYDLEKCQQEYLSKSHIQDFRLGEWDISDRFQIPEKLYGRETEITTLLAAFERVSKGITELMLVTGFSGIGKTALVNEVHKPIVHQRGYFIKGKFDQLKRNIPFSALVQAFQNLMRQLLTQSNTQVEKWKHKITTALGDNAQVIINVIPELERIIGKQPLLTQLDANATENRFKLLFQKFVQVFTCLEHPLVIFLDDLQWADSASLKLLQILVSESDKNCLLLIGAYRDNEVSKAHPLILTLEKIRKSATVNEINLTPLSKVALNNLISDTLSCSCEKAKPLTEQVYLKTQGNPFFSNQFLYSLYKDGLIFISSSQTNLVKKGWQCNITEIKTLSVSPNVVEFIAHQLRKLPQETQNLLKLAACIGNQFDLETLAMIQQKSQLETAAAIWKALQEGLILPTNEIYKFFQDDTINVREKLFNNQLIANYKFLHDRVQQAAYSLILESQKQSTHLTIGKLLLQNTPQEKQEDKVFEIVNQLNIGITLITEPKEKHQLAQLNLVAARKARASTAYDAVSKYGNFGLELLPEDSWKTQYNLTLSLHEIAAEAVYVTGNFAKVEKLVDIVLQNAQTLLDKIKSYEVRIQSYIAQSQPLEAVLTGLKVLQYLGVNLTTKPTKLQILLALFRIKLALLGRKVETLIDLPNMTDAYQLAVLRIMRNISFAAYATVPKIMPLLAIKVISLSLKYGNNSHSAYGYACYSIILCGVMGDIDTAYQFTQLAFKLLEKYNAKDFKCETFTVISNFINHRKNHLKEGLNLLLEAYQAGLETGNLETAAATVYLHSCHRFFLGHDLAEVEREMYTYSQAIATYKKESLLNSLKLFRQVVLNLLGTEDSCELVGESYDERIRLPLALAANQKSEIFCIYFTKLKLNYLFEKYPEAIKNANIAADYLEQFTVIPVTCLFYFYDSLARLGLYPSVCKSEQRQIFKKVSYNQKKLQKWAREAPMNHLHKFFLVEAEVNRVLGKTTQAIEYYEQAINLARENGYLNEESLANELATKFYLGWGKHTVAQAYLTQAYYGYARWGAQAKLTFLKKRYPEFSQIANLEHCQKPQSLTSSTVTYDNFRSPKTLDIETIFKLSQALSVDIQLERVFPTLMKLLIENAGAEKGTLILIEENDKVVAAQYAADIINTVENPLVCNLPTSQTEREIPLTVINYVERTQEFLVISDISFNTTFASDAYIINHQPKSVLCTPIVNQGKLLGILYLENNLMTGAFTSDRLTIIQILTSQVAISIENARLYERVAEYSRTLEVRVEQRTEELQQLAEKLQKALVAADSANRAKSDFLANMSHELRTPLNVILGFSKLMTDDDNLSNEQQESLEYINNAGEHLLSLINDILELSKIEAGRVSLNESSFDLMHMLNNLECMLRFKAESQGLKFKFEYGTNIPQCIITDEIKLRQILINLLGNAIKFTEKGGVSLRVFQQNIEALESNSVSLYFEVEDTGIGINPEEINLLFTPFGQTESGRKHQQGTGLGLRISQKYVQLMGGDITLSSIVGKGSLFKFNIKCKTDDIHKTQNIPLHRRIVGLVPQSEYRILVVDDSVESRLFLARMLAKVGFSVREAENGKIAVDIYSTWKPHLILMDIRMPVMDGFEATKLIKANSAVNNPDFQTVIVALTASAFEEERKLILSVGCDDFICKPFQEEVLMTKISQYLRVEYIYGENTVENNEVNLKDSELASCLSQLSVELVEKIYNAASQGNDSLILNLIQEMPKENLILVSVLTDLIHNFQFEKLMRITEQVMSQSVKLQK
jgi:predicted ATPase/signal transduction histidine kinase/CheY-like chemotaxis protein